jgi:hypothetical protein
MLVLLFVLWQDPSDGLSHGTRTFRLSLRGHAMTARGLVLQTSAAPAAGVSLSLPLRFRFSSTVLIACILPDTITAAAHDYLSDFLRLGGGWDLERCLLKASAIRWA